MSVRKATINDVPEMLKLINGYAKEGLMLMKSPYQIYRNIQSFCVYEEDNQIIGCCRLNVVWKNLAEIASLAVSKKHNKKGIGRKLVRFSVNEGVELGIYEFFTLTYQSAFFEKCGFAYVEKETLPHKVFGDCLMCPKIDGCDEMAYILKTNTKI